MADHPLFSVSDVTPEGAAFEGDAEMLIVPGAAGEIGVLARHAPLVALLKAGSTRVHIGDGTIQEYATGPGFFQVLEEMKGSGGRKRAEKQEGSGEGSESEPSGESEGPRGESTSENGNEESAEKEEAEAKG